RSRSRRSERSARATSAPRLERRTVGNAPKYAENSVAQSARVGRGPAELTLVHLGGEGRREPPLRERLAEAESSAGLGVGVAHAEDRGVARLRNAHDPADAIPAALGRSGAPRGDRKRTERRVQVARREQR